MSEAIALYLHIPFCRRKCGYCSFISYEGRQTDISAYVKALKKELVQRSEGEPVSSIYFGGGTPSLLSAAQVADILGVIHSHFVVGTSAEISMEANPGTVDEGYLKAVRKAGINRLSLGVQSLNGKELALVGRIHSADEARQAVKFARNAGFDNLNLDLIYGLPGQSLADWRETLENAMALKPEHLSLYALTLEEGTPMLRAMEENGLPELEEDLAAEQYELAEDLLGAAGYRHYEISNWAKPGYECRHNLVYWHNRDYFGVGVAAHSSIGGHRLANDSNLDEYLNTSYFLPEMDEVIDDELRLAETVILGLRLDEGVNSPDIRERFGVDILSVYNQQIKETIEAGLLEHAGNHLKLTRRGRLLSNEVFWRLLPAEAKVNI